MGINIIEVYTSEDYKIVHKGVVDWDIDDGLLILEMKDQVIYYVIANILRWNER